MTKDEHNELYEELKEVITQRGVSTQHMSEAQTIFVEALESASFGASLLEIYTDLIDDNPAVTLRNLHSFITGIALGQSGYTVPLDNTKTYH